MSKKKDELLIVRIFKKIINIRGWFDYDRLRAFANYIMTGAKKLFIPQTKHVPDHSFDEMMKKFNLTETDLVLKKQGLWRLSALMVICAFFIFLYVIYCIYKGNYFISLVSLVIMCVALVFAFRYHFLYFQICEHKLGCTLKEWYQKGLRGKHS